jgi:glutamine amidotransferase
VVSGDPAVIRAARRVVLPGQSAMPDTMRCLDKTGLRGVVLDVARDRPFLGVCLGLQMLFQSSAEGPTPCLELFAGRVVRFREEDLVVAGERLKVPHMGWSPVHQMGSHPLWEGISDGERFYFAHSYYPVPEDASLVAGTTNYPTPFTCAIARANIFAVQFHPEKSHHAGLRLLTNFVTWDGHS